MEAFKPELLSPAGDMARLKCAVKFGADAVYLAGKMFGMRSAPANFSENELEEAVAYAHESGVKVYLTANVLPRNDELSELPGFLSRAKAAGVDAFIISDLGVMEAAKKYAAGVAIHVSTQHGVTNYAAANALYELGARRIVAARELTLKEIKEIRANIPADCEIEAFVHGAMCVSFSGRCLISNYLTGRDSNRGECAQPCRWKYSLVEEKRPGQYFPVDEDESGTYFFNSGDLCMIEHIPELIDAGVSSFKIEGRAKSEYYVSVITNAYRAAIDGFLQAPSVNYKPEKWVCDEVFKVSYRPYCTGFFFNKPHENTNVTYRGMYRRQWDVAAVVLKCENGRVYGSQRNRFFEGDRLEALLPGQKPFELTATNLTDENGVSIPAANKATMNFSFESDVILPEGTILRKQRDDSERIIA